MNDVRKVVSEAIDRIVCDVAELPDRNSPEDQPEMMLVTADELRLLIQSAFDEAIPASGEAWYPSYNEVSDRVGTIAPLCRVDPSEIIRATADLIRERALSNQLSGNSGQLTAEFDTQERGGQVGGDVVGWQFSIQNEPFGVWSGWIDCPQSEAQHLATQSGFKVRELIPRQPGAKAVVKESLTTEEAPGRVVAEPRAWLVLSRTGMVRACWTTEPFGGQLLAAEADGDTITPLYSQPPQSAGVPAGLIDAMAEAIKDAHKTGRYGECPGIGWGEARAAFKALIDNLPAAPPTAAAQGDDLAMPAEHARIGDAIWRAHCDLPDDLCITVDIENFAISVTLNRNMCAIGDIWDSRDHAGGLAKAILAAISHAQAQGVSGAD